LSAAIRATHTSGCGAALTTYAVETRYPGVVESVSHEEWIEAVASANLVLRWAVAVIGPPGN
jgi:hypothetical protein